MSINEEPRSVDPTIKLAVRYDDVTGTTIYVGWAQPGTLTSVSEWKIVRKTVSGDDWVMEWADGNTLFDNEWDERTSLSYS